MQTPQEPGIVQTSSVTSENCNNTGLTVDAFINIHFESIKFEGRLGRRVLFATDVSVLDKGG